MTLRELEMEIEHLVTENSSDLQISKKIKSVIRNYREDISNNFDNTVGKGRNFLSKHTKFYDSIISIIYKTVLRRMFNNYLPMRNSIPITIIALGSYGREELTIHSDIDLMIAFREIEGYNINAIIEKFLYMVWDSGLKLGHRVHNINELQDVAKDDITIKTALIESRNIIGSSFVWSVVQSELNRIRATDIKGYILQREMDRESRYRKHQNYSMQPNIKDGYGGLRDANMLFWILNILYRVNSVQELRGELFSEEDYKRFFLAIDFLQQVRTVSHLVRKKKQDKIDFEMLPDILQHLNLSNQFTLLNKILHSMWTINRFSNLVLRKVIKRYLFDASRIRELRKSRIDRGVYILNSELFLSDKLSVKTLNSLLKLLIKLPDIDLKINNTIYGAVEKIDSETKPSAKLIIQLMRRENPFTPLQILFRQGLLHSVIPLFGKVRFLPQFDGYHSHTVDIHSLYTLKALQSIKNGFVEELYKSLNRQDKQVIKFASLFHDIGKGRVGDHSEVGAKVWRSYGRELGLTDEVVESVAHLIKIHTFMTQVAYREDLQNERVIYSFVAKVSSSYYLDLLYILTYADIRGVSSDADTQHSRKLLQLLYDRAKTAFQNRDLIRESERRNRTEKQIQKLEKFTELKRTLQKKIVSIDSNSLFLKHSAGEIVDIGVKANSVEDYKIELSSDETLSIKVYRKSSFDIAYFLNRLSMFSVVSLDIFQLFNGIKYFHIIFSEPVEADEVEPIRELLHSSMNREQKPYKLLVPKIRKEEISVDCNYSESYIKLGLNTIDQKGLLAYTLKIFEDQQIDISSSKIYTFKRRVRDMFLIEKEGVTCQDMERAVENLITVD
jgi:[protein-PII] uridylyltransferase